jgi:hypothetical protein
LLTTAAPIDPCLGLSFDNPLLGGGDQVLALTEGQTKILGERPVNVLLTVA